MPAIRERINGTEAHTLPSFEIVILCGSRWDGDGGKTPGPKMSGPKTPSRETLGLETSDPGTPDPGTLGPETPDSGQGGLEQSCGRSTGKRPDSEIGAPTIVFGVTSWHRPGGVNLPVVLTTATCRFCSRRGSDVTVEEPRIE